MNCQAVIREISNYIDGEMDSDIRSQLESHLGGCKECTSMIDQTRLTIEIFCDSEIVELPEDVRSRLHEALRRKMLSPHL